jgi:hypothetical protein
MAVNGKVTNFREAVDELVVQKRRALALEKALKKICWSLPSEILWQEYPTRPKYLKANLELAQRIARTTLLEEGLL